MNFDHDVLSGSYSRTFSVVCPSIPPNQPFTPWLDVPAASIAAFVSDCTMTAYEFAHRYGEDGVWSDRVYIKITIPTSAEHKLEGVICPLRGTNVCEQDGGLYFVDSGLTLIMQVDGLDLVYMPYKTYGAILITQDGRIILQ